MKELGLLFGNTAHAAATVLTAFFCGLGAGSYYWGKRAAKIKNTLRAYAYLEFGVAVSAIGYFAILYAYRTTYPFLFENFYGYPVLFLITKFLLSLLLLFPPALFMGGTLPFMSQFLVRQKQSMGLHVSGLYATNTLGAACGTLAAGFVLPRFLGFNISFALAMAVNLLIGIAAFFISRKGIQSVSMQEGDLAGHKSKKTAISLRVLTNLAFISGLVTLALQVLWVRMFSQVLHNSVYTFSSILTIFLLMLALAAAFSNVLMRLKLKPIISLCTLLTLGGILTIASSFVFSEITEGLAYISAEHGWWHYILKVLGIALLVMGPALLCLGTILPLTFKLAEQQGESVGHLVGKLSSINTVGAVIGSLLAGFVLLEAVGLWQAIRLVACLYFLAALLIIFSKYFNRKWATIPVTFMMLFALTLDLSVLPRVNLGIKDADEKLVELWEGSAGTVAVTRSQNMGGLRIKVNNHYTLGSTSATLLEEIQTDVPMLLHPNPQKVYMLGLGTGITAGAALNYPIKKLTVTELVSDVITASRKHFAPFLHGLFSDDRAEVIAEDGRNFLKGTSSLYDVIIADLFVLWKAGTGYLYTQEHYQAVAERLEPSGLFMQWLPSHQMTEVQFKTIAKTMLSVFPQVTLWRGDFLYGASLVGLLGQNQALPLPSTELKKQIRVAGLDFKTLPLLSYYVGNLSAQKNLFDDAELNRDDFPVIVYDAPITQQLYLSRQVNYLTGTDLIDFTALLGKNLPIEYDNFLANASDSDRQLVTMGAALHRAETLKGIGDMQAAAKAYRPIKEVLGKWKRSDQSLTQ